MFKGMDILDFNREFICNEDCLQYLFDFKWKSGFKCSRCGGTKSWKGRTKFHLRCSACWYDESATANTVFHKIKIPLVNAFAMLFQIAVPKKASSCLGLSREYGVGRESAWLFKRKCQEAVRTMVSAEQARYHHLKEMKLNKKRKQHANTKNSGKLKSDQELKPKAKLTFIIKSKSIPGQIKAPQKMISFSPLLDEVNGSVIVHNFKTWISGIHHHCSERFLTGYLQEYFFRHHYRKQMNEIWHRLVECFMNSKPYYYKAIEA